MIGITIWLYKNQGENAGLSKSSNDNYSSKKNIDKITKPKQKPHELYELFYLRNAWDVKTTLIKINQLKNTFQKEIVYPNLP